MTRYGILVADSGRARLFSCEGRPQAVAWQELEAWLNPTARLGEHDLYADRPGRTVDSKGRGHGVERSSAREHQAQNFARMLGEELNRAVLEKRFERLVLIAPAEFLGTLRPQLSKAVQEHVTATIDRDFSKLPLADLQSSVTPHLNH